MKIIEPQTSQEFEAYYFLRWDSLRRPWGKPRGTEKDELESSSIHAMMINEKNEPIAVGRIHFNSPDQAQIRYMAVSEKYRGKNYGNKIINYLENKAREKGRSLVILQARENAVKFYENNGYIIKEKSFLLWDSIQHYLMEKKI